MPIPRNGQKHNLPLLGYAAVIGLAAGLVTSLYRFILTYLETFSIAAYGYISQHAALILPAFIVLAAMGLGTGALIKKYRMASGSGIPQIKGVLTGYLKANWLSTLIAKFVGGAVAMAAGLSLGREGPSIQIGASVAAGIGNKLVKNESDRRILMASGASAGLSAAFNAPLSGVVFTLEELFKYFSPLVLLTSMIAAVVSDAVSRVMLGSGSIFNFSITGSIPISQYWILLVLGAALGVFGAVYNKVLLVSVKLFEKIKDRRFRPVLAFLLAGVLGLLFPAVICGGHVMIDTVSIQSSLGFLCAALLLKFLFSMVSYGSGAPGGIFFPLLVMGAVFGAIFAQLSISFFGVDQALFANLVILAMTGLFTAIVHAPITGIVLLVEMTGSFSHFLPLSVVALTAYVVATLCGGKPIYDSLLLNMIPTQGEAAFGKDAVQRVTVETVVHFGSIADQKYVHELPLPDSCTLASIKRHGKEFVPDSDSHILAGDYLVCLTDSPDETRAREALDALTKSP
ncbi:MAG: chloride channel protein [Eggerthellaceae bacterium]|nr:chloride channel protein [Eggerthellaceae bacterium]